jgi:hypothetical protein
VDSAGYNSIQAPATGTIKNIDTKKGSVTIHYDRHPLLHYAGVAGSVEKIIPEREVQIKFDGWKLQGVVGFGRQATGSLVYCDDLKNISAADDSSILVVNDPVDLDFLKNVEYLGYKGLIAPSIHYRQLIRFTKEDIGVALTGNEDIPFPLVITQGFGQFSLPQVYQDFFAAHHGEHIFIDGHTQIRAGVIRPQIIIQKI